jgi:predicted porin
MANKELNVNQGTKSRLGFRGVEDLGGGLSAKFELEHRLLPDTGATNPSGGNQFWDKAIVGVTSQSFGEITLGRDYVPVFYAQYVMDPWLNQGIAEVGGTTYAFAGYTSYPTTTQHGARTNNGVFYKAKFGGLSLLASVGASEADDVDHRYGLGAMFVEGGLTIVAAYDQAPVTSATTNAETDDVAILGVSYDFGAIKPRLSVARSTLNRGVGLNVETNPISVTLAATAPIGASGLLKFGYTQLDWDANVLGGTGEDTKQQKIALGYEHNLSKRTAIYTDLTHGRSKGPMLTALEPNKKVSGLDIGVRHSF